MFVTLTINLLSKLYNMANTALNEPIVTKLFENFRYDLLKAVIFIIIFAATIIYANSESGKYYPQKHVKSTIIKK